MDVHGRGIRKSEVIRLENEEWDHLVTLGNSLSEREVIG
jgi:hypothetical protein